MFWFFGYKAGRILAPQPGIELTLPALEGEVLTTGLPGTQGVCFSSVQSLSRVRLFATP